MFENKYMEWWGEVAIIEIRRVNAGHYPLQKLTASAI
jgi:hypothetical protein